MNTTMRTQQMILNIPIAIAIATLILVLMVPSTLSFMVPNSSGGSGGGGSGSGICSVVVRHGYLDSLNTGGTPLGDFPEAARPEEFYDASTNPMANNWAGSYNEQYGGYLHRLAPKAHPQERRQTTSEETSLPSPRAPPSPPSPDDLHQSHGPSTSNPMTNPLEGYPHPWLGGYLDSLQQPPLPPSPDDE